MTQLLPHRQSNKYPHEGHSRESRSRVAVLLAVFSLAVVGVAMWGTVVTPTAVAAASECRPRLEGSTVVVVVVKNGASPATLRCVELTGTVNGFDALRAAGHTLRIEGGFLCAIDGVPATGCATASGFDGTYWRYFNSPNDGTWSYSPVGAGRRLGTGCMAEGWVYSNAAGAGQPPVNPAPVVPCSVAPVPTTTPVPVIPPTTVQPPVKTPPPSQPTPGSNTPTPGPVPPVNHHGNAQTPDTPVLDADDDDVPRLHHAESSTFTSERASELNDDNDSGAVASELEGDTGVADGDRDESGSHAVENTRGPERVEAGEIAAASGESDSGSIFGTIVVAVIIAGLVGAAWWKRRRSMVESAP